MIGFFLPVCKDDANEDGAESENEVNDESLIATVQSANALEEAGSCVKADIKFPLFKIVR